MALFQRSATPSKCLGELYPREHSIGTDTTKLSIPSLTRIERGSPQALAGILPRLGTRLAFFSFAFDPSGGQASLVVQCGAGWPGMSGLGVLVEE